MQKVFLVTVCNFPKGIFSTREKAFAQLQTLYTEYVAHQQELEEAITFELDDIDDFGEICEVEIDNGNY